MAAHARLEDEFTEDNKSFSYQDTPPLHQFLVCILNFDKTSKIFSKCNHLFGRYLRETHFVHKSWAITLLFLNEIVPLAIPYHSSPIPMAMESLKKIGKKVLKLEHGNEVQSIFDIHHGP